MQNETTINHLEKINDKFVDGLTKTLPHWGISKVSAQIFAYLQTQNGPVSLNEIVENLYISKGNVSLNIRFLDDLNVIRKVWVKGDRRDYYESVVSLSDFVMKLLGKKIKADVSLTLEHIQESITLLQNAITICKGNEADKARYFMQKLQGQRSFYEALHGIIKEADGYDMTIEPTKIRSIWNTLKQQLKRS